VLISVRWLLNRRLTIGNNLKKNGMKINFRFPAGGSRFFSRLVCFSIAIPLYFRRIMSIPTLIIGIAGGTGSGKTTVTHRILDHFDDRSVIVLRHDFYYRDIETFDGESPEKVNFDHPDALETSLLIEHLKMLKAGQAIRQPLYDYTTYRRLQDSLAVMPKSVVIVEGILIFVDKELRDLMDIKIFVDTDADERLLRRLRRDLLERGRSIESVMEQYTTTVKPMHLEFVEPSKRWADVIIPKGGENFVAIDMVVTKLRQMLGTTGTHAGTVPVR
jgi:uridine kinase